MAKYVLILWLLLGSALGSAYFSPPVQRLVRSADAAHSLQTAQDARQRAAALSFGSDRSNEAQQRAEAEWQATLTAARAALQTFGDDQHAAKLLAGVLAAEALAQTGDAVGALEMLAVLELEQARQNDPAGTEAIRAALAQTNFQIALMCQAESADDDDWIRYAEMACGYYQDLAKSASDATSAEVYRRNLACATRFLFGGLNGADCWSMPGKRTLDCKKKMRRMERERPSGGAKSPPQYTPPPSDKNDPVRRNQIEKTKLGKDEGL